MQFCPAEKKYNQKIARLELNTLSQRFRRAGFESSKTWLNMNDSSTNTVLVCIICFSHEVVFKL